MDTRIVTATKHPRKMHPCPACGSGMVFVAIYQYKYHDLTVTECNPYCESCGYELDDYPSVEKAVAAWNGEDRLVATIIKYLRTNSSFEHPIKGSSIASHYGISDVKVREVVNAARRNGIPVCSSSYGYYYSEDKAHISKTVESLKNRIASQESAIDGLSALLA